MLAALPKISDTNVLVSFDTSDDAGVYKLTQECALVQTLDFFTPIVDDPFTFGAIAAANSLSDVYAMGGTPLTALSILCWPAKAEPEEIAAVVRGGASKMVEAGCVIVGGHSVNDDEPKFGYSVTGTVHPDRVRTNAGARPGDIVVLTKAIGTGVISTALKRGIARDTDVQAAVDSMLTLNRAAAEAMAGFEVHGCTDVTGFGLVCHAREIALASGVTIEIDAASVPLLPGAYEYARQGAVPGGLNDNREFASCSVRAESPVDEPLEALLYDPQTSGGLFITMAGAEFPGGVRIGRVLTKQDKDIILK